MNVDAAKMINAYIFWNKWDALSDAQGAEADEEKAAMLLANRGMPDRPVANKGRDGHDLPFGWHCDMVNGVGVHVCDGNGAKFAQGLNVVTGKFFAEQELRRLARLPKAMRIEMRRELVALLADCSALPLRPQLVVDADADADADADDDYEFNQLWIHHLRIGNPSKKHRCVNFNLDCPQCMIPVMVKEFVFDECPQGATTSMPAQLARDTRMKLLLQETYGNCVGGLPANIIDRASNLKLEQFIEFCIYIDAIATHKATAGGGSAMIEKMKRDFALRSLHTR